MRELDDICLNTIFQLIQCIRVEILIISMQQNKQTPLTEEMRDLYGYRCKYWKIISAYLSYVTL